MKNSVAQGYKVFGEDWKTSKVTDQPFPFEPNQNMWLRIVFVQQKPEPDLPPQYVGRVEDGLWRRRLQDDFPRTRPLIDVL